jgi:hypothetical protein
MRRVIWSLRLAMVACFGFWASAAQADGWRAESPPNPNPIFNQLYGVSCASSDACEAVGTDEARWDGVSWQLQPDPTGPGAGSLTAVSCARADACTAVGTVAARWNGASWTVQSLPAPGAVAVSCPTISFCLAVGGGNGPIAESSNGTSWSLEPTPSGPLNAVSCTAPDRCTGVGGGGLIERWNGTSWSVQSSPMPAGAANVDLNGVSCTARSRCIAVGQSVFPVGGTRPLAELWTGSSWTIVSTPTPPRPTGGYAPLVSVSCHEGRFCIAIGVRLRFDVVPIAFAERWDGVKWRLVGSPFDGTVNLGSVSCPTRTRCQAVGYTSLPASTMSAALAAEYRR